MKRAWEPAARVRASSYVTRMHAGQHELLVFDYPTVPEAGTHLPGGGVEAGERPDDAAIREVIEETGISGTLALQGVVGVQQSRYDTGQPCINIYFHLRTNEHRGRWSHTMIGDPSAWDTGLQVTCRFVSLDDGAELLRTSWHRQEEFVRLLRPSHGRTTSWTRYSRTR